MSTTSNTKSIHRSVAILKLPRPVPALITYAQGIVTAMTGNPAFPTPAPTLAAMMAAIGDLQIAETAALSRLKGAVVTRNDKRVVLVTLLEQLRAYIQATADANLENSANIIGSAAIAVRKTPARAARAFHVKAGPVSGSAKLAVPSVGRRAFYEWEYSTDGGKTWTLAATTLQGKTTVTGLPAASTVWFRYRPGTKTGEGDWSQAVSELVK